ncbi:unnamed protein product [Pylaiella littoralis]
MENVIQAKWVFNVKSDEYGWTTKMKARLVARGDQQVENVDFGERYAPTVSVSCVRMLAALACELNLDLCHFDVEQAFVRSELEEDVYMRLPKGCGALSGMIVKLNKSLYGLRQASRSWHGLLKKCLLDLGFEQCLVDTCVFRLIEDGCVVLILVVHVDDIFAVGERERCDRFGMDLNKSVPVKNLGELRWYSGCFYERDMESGRLTISQQTYTEELAAEYGVEWGKSVPLSTGMKLSEFDPEEADTEFPFRVGWFVDVVSDADEARHFECSAGSSEVLCVAEAGTLEGSDWHLGICQED